MAFKRKLKKLARSPGAFFVDAINKRFGGERTKVRRLPVITLFVPVFGDVSALPTLFKSVFGRAGGGGGAVDLALLVHESDTRVLEALERDGPWPYVRILRHAEDNVFAAIDHFLPRARGEWVGFSSPDAVYGLNYFSVLRQEMATQYELAACVTELAYGSAARSKSMNAHIKGPRKLRLPGSGPVPFIDLENIFLRKGLLGDVAMHRAAHGEPEACWRGLSDLLAYFEILGDAVIKIFPTLHKRVGARRAAVEPFGIGPAGAIEPVVGNLLTLAQASRHTDLLPPWLQMRVAFSVFNLFEHLMARRGAFDHMTPTELDELDAAIGHLMQRISFDLIEDKGAGLARGAVRQSTWYRYLGICPLVPPIFFDDFDATSGLVRGRVLYPFRTDLAFVRNARSYRPPIDRVTCIAFAGKPLMYETLVWVSVLGMSHMEVVTHGRQCPLYVRNKRVPELTGSLFDRYTPPPEFSFSESPRAFALRYLAARGTGSERYRDCWLFIDKDSQADDNAEHFYRWVLNHTSEPAFFVLRRDSRDWARLAAEGFRLLEFGSLQHKLALLNASWLFSSHAAPFVVNVLPRKYFGDMLNYKFCFLQHGVTKDDQSAWLNSRQIDLLVTVGQAECESMSSGAYKFTRREVALTGFPRYDALMQKRTAQPRRIVIMPTWRLHLAGELVGKTSQRAYNPAFADSDFCKAWGGLLSDVALMQKLAAAGHEVVFLAHPNLQPYIDLFHLAPGVQLADLGGASIQDYLADCALLITDYSSVAFDVAYLRRPVLYYQFDHETFFASHTYGRGYFDYEAHGFGPVAHDEVELHAALDLLQGSGYALGGSYARRIEQFFAFNDAENSHRVYQEVLKRSGAFFGG